MKKTIYILVSALSFIITGCSVTGKYFSGDGFNNTYLAINKDGTFTYITFQDVNGIDTINGRWTKNKNILTLNSLEQPSFKPNSIVEKIIPNQDKKLIIVQNMDVTSYKSVISLNNGQEIDTLNYINDTTYWDDPFPIFVTGTYTDIDTLKSIRILKTNNWTDCVLKDSMFYISNPNSNVIVIYAQPYNQYSRMKYLVDTEWKFKYNRIYVWRKSKSKYAKNSYLRKE